MSRTLQYRRYGGPDVLELADREEPRPGTGQVRLAVRAASVNPVDWKILSGAMASGDAPDAPAVPGIDVAGVVEETGEGVDGLRVGDEVLGHAAGGSFAAQALADAGALVAKPAALAWEAAASLPVAATTAYRVLALLGLGAGDDTTRRTLVVDGASGAVGVLAVQLAVARGVTVVGTAGPSHQDAVAALGATPVVYGEGLADRVRAAAPQGVDAGFDAAGKGSLPDLVALTGSADRVVTIADPAAGEHGVRFTGGGGDEVEGALADAAARVADGSLRLPTITTYPLEGTARALTDNRDGAVKGKLVVVP